MQDVFVQIKTSLLESLGTFTNMFSVGFSKIIGAIILWIVGWIIIKVIRRILNKVLTSIQFDNITDKMNLGPRLEKAGITMTPTAMFIKFISFVMMLLLVMAISSMMGLDQVSEMINEFIAYLPKLFMALVVFLVGFWMADLARGVVKAATSSIGGSSSGIISGFAFYGIITMTTLMALKKVGIETSIIDQVLTIVITVFLSAMALAYGLGAKEVMRNMISGFFSKKKYQIGQSIQIGEIRGKIVDIDSISVTVKTTEEIVVIPAKTIVEEQIKIIPG